MSNDRQIQWYQRSVKGYMIERPGLTRFIYTGEDLNPWRCESCATKKQREKADKLPTEKSGLPYVCCRKCGLFTE